MKLAVLSDTHGLLRPQVAEYLKRTDAILHAGDIDTPDILAALERYGPLYAVRGNNDTDWAMHIPYKRMVTLDGVIFYLVHNKRDIPIDLAHVDVVVYGHSHQFAKEEKDGMLFLNPGSCGPCRYGQSVTIAMLEIRQGQIQVEKIEFPPETP